MTFETLTVIELLLSVSNYPEDKCDKIRDELSTMDKKAKAFDTFLKYKEHVEKYNNSDCHELERVFEFVMKEYEEDK